MENEAKQKDKAFNKLITTLKHLVTNHERLIQDDDEFKAFLIDSVCQGELKPAHAIYLYCSKHGVDEFNVVQIGMHDGEPRSPILDFFDAILAGQDISPLLNSIDIERGP